MLYIHNQGGNKLCNIKLQKLKPILEKEKQRIVQFFLGLALLLP